MEDNSNIEKQSLEAKIDQILERIEIQDMTIRVIGEEIYKLSKKLDNVKKSIENL